MLYSHWTLDYIASLDPAEVRSFNGVVRAYQRVLREIEAGKFRPSQITDDAPETTPLED